MSQIIDVTNPLTVITTAAVVVDIAAIMTVVEVIKITLTESQQTGLITVSTGKEAIIKAMYTDIMEPYQSTMPSDVTLANFADMTLEEANTDKLIGLLNPIISILVQHLAILKNNRMLITTEVLDNAKLAAKKNNDLNKAVKKIITTYYSRGAAKPSASYEMAASSTLGLGGVKTSTPLVNTGDASFSYVKTNGDISQTIIVYPGTASKIPKGWTNITFINLSATSKARFNIFMK